MRKLFHKLFWLLGGRYIKVLWDDLHGLCLFNSCLLLAWALIERISFHFINGIFLFLWHQVRLVIIRSLGWYHALNHLVKLVFGIDQFLQVWLLSTSNVSTLEFEVHCLQIFTIGLEGRHRVIIAVDCLLHVQAVVQTVRHVLLKLQGILLCITKIHYFWGLSAPCQRDHWVSLWLRRFLLIFVLVWGWSFLNSRAIWIAQIYITVSRVLSVPWDSLVLKSHLRGFRPRNVVCVSFIQGTFSLGASFLLTWCWSHGKDRG